MIKNIKKLSFTSLVLAYFIGLSPITATEEVTNLGDKRNASVLTNVRDITPIKGDMSKEQAEIAIYKFLQTEVLKEENELHMEDIVKQEKVQANGNGRMFPLITLVDGTQWVPAFDGLQRFLGALYLKKALEHHLISDFSVVETKFFVKDGEEDIIIEIKKLQDEPLKDIYTINSKNFISLSRYIGDKKPDLDFPFDLSNLRKLTGFSDFSANANLRILGEEKKVTVIDTEYGSFSNDDLGSSQRVESEIGGTTFTFSMKSFIS
jgi:hypothetical protein